jgi:DNA-binding CsgD family transcriptional regulator
VGFTEAWLSGDPAPAARILRREGFTEHLMRWRVLRPHVARAVRMAIEGGDRDLARRLADQAEVYARQNPSVGTAVGLAAHAAGLVFDDLDLLAQAAAGLRSGPRPLVYADAVADHGQALLRRRQRKHGIAALTEAVDIYQEVGAAGEAHRVRTKLRAAGVKRPPHRQDRAVAGWAALTSTEKRVARLIADGHTNRSAAAELSISPHTINTHLGSVFRKLAVTSRVQLALAVLRDDPER